MKTDIDTLKDSFWVGYDAYYESRIEAEEVWNQYHNRQWTTEQLGILERRGQPKETFNVIKLFSRMLVGYYSTIINNVVADPVQMEDSTEASLLTDTIRHVFENNNMDVEGDEMKLSAIVSGLMCAHIAPIDTGERDRFGRPIYRLRVSYVPEYEIVLDPLSTREDYSDARFLHRFKWVPRETVERIWGKDKADELDAHYNYLDIEEAEYHYAQNDWYYGRYRVFDNYLITHTVIEDDDGKRWSIFWCGDTTLEKKEITYRDVKWNYRVVRLHKSNKTEYYGIFREVTETQKAINQALVKLQLMANSQKVFVEKEAVDNVAEFTDAVNRVNGVIPMKSLKGLKVEALGREALEQYQIIDQAFDRIQRILSINDSFLGMAFASDSGRKVKLQQNATIMGLRYLTVRIEMFYKLMGVDIAGFIKQYYTAEQVLRVSDDIVKERWIALNQPEMRFTGNMDPQTGEPIMVPIFEEVLDPENGEPMVDDDGNLIFAPIPRLGTELEYMDANIRIEAVNYSDEDERTQLMTETVMSGQMGQMLSQVNPAGFFKIAGLSLRTMKTRYSPEISRIFEDTAEMLSGNPEDEDAAAMIAGNLNSGANSGEGRPNGGSRSLKLPTNTNEAPA